MSRSRADNIDVSDLSDEDVEMIEEFVKTIRARAKTILDSNIDNISLM